MGNETDDAALDDCRSLTIASALDRLGDSVVHFLDVAPVDALGRHVVRNPVIREVIRRQRFGGRRDGPLVVLDNEYDRQVPVRGEDERRVERAATRPAVADGRHRHVVGPLHLFRQPESDGGVLPGADRCGVSVQLPIDVGDVHLAAVALVRSPDAPVEFRHDLR